MMDLFDKELLPFVTSCTLDKLHGFYGEGPIINEKNLLEEKINLKEENYILEDYIFLKCKEISLKNLEFNKAYGITIVTYSLLKEEYYKNKLEVPLITLDTISTFEQDMIEFGRGEFIKAISRNIHKNNIYLHQYLLFELNNHKPNSENCMDMSSLEVYSVIDCAKLVYGLFYYQVDSTFLEKTLRI